ncbi:MAG: hypothetical protein M1827_007051 [Pycnora praestabilis]|nr:MAG: hypothetical protein M1827_007051 [Pycnora praestabilis]
MASSATPLTPRPNSMLDGSGRMKKNFPTSNGKPKGKPNGSILSFFKKADPQSLIAGNKSEPDGRSEGLFLADEDTEWHRLPQARSPTPDDLFNAPGWDTTDTKSHESTTTARERFRYNENSVSNKRRKMEGRSPSAPQGGENDGLTINNSAFRDGSINDLSTNLEINGAQMEHQSPSNRNACSPPPPDFAEQIVNGPEQHSPSSENHTLHNGAEVADRIEATGRRKAKHSVGPFVEDSDSEEESPNHDNSLTKGIPNGEIPLSSTDTGSPAELAELEGIHRMTENEDSTEHAAPIIPSFKKEPTSYGEDDGLDNIEDFGDDEYAGGEEFVGRRLMEEERRLEMAENGLDYEDYDDLPDQCIKNEDDDHSETGDGLPTSENSLATCPICNASFDGISDAEASVHVNHCLDGTPTSLPESKAAMKEESPGKASKPLPISGRFQRAARPAKPGQENPFAVGSSSAVPSSAFSKLMSGHAEDAAWANAAAAESAARGRPAYQRTCPFYKILPGLFICVDAFRYGAVEGCQAYFLSHFHSDHYVGLTSTWQHGPIYCSRVTGNLVRQQLRVDPKWVVDLRFEERVEVPGTNGVEVTMIPANHCPGSSLFLFEKNIGKGKSPKLQRILHCGDFRACPAHLQHPLLRPDLINAVNGKNMGQQKIDVCYLDTTYLNPRYAFPSQEEVIKACADMCVSLKKERADDTDGWEQMKKERAGSGMVKFVRSKSDTGKEQDDLNKKEENEDDIDAMKVNDKGGSKSRGRLLVVVGTYSIGKERIALGIARALDSRIYAPAQKQRICVCLEDPELNARLTRDPKAAQVHLAPLMEIRAETLNEYLTEYKQYFSRVVGFRPSGWNYRPPNSRFVESPAVQTVLHSENWKSRYSMAELIPQRGSTRESSCFGVPYSEHSSFRELTMFCCALRIDKIIPTVNIGSAKSREKMKAWCEKWAMEKKKAGLFQIGEGKGTW